MRLRRVEGSKASCRGNAGGFGGGGKSLREGYASGAASGECAYTDFMTTSKRVFVGNGKGFASANGATGNNACFSMGFASGTGEGDQNGYGTLGI